jgi:hypothetical protein
MPAYEYQFKLLDIDDKGASLKPKAIVVDNNIFNK